MSMGRNIRWAVGPAAAVLLAAMPVRAEKDALFLGTVKITPSVQERAGVAGSTASLNLFRDVLDSTLQQELGRSPRFTLVDRRNMQALEDEEKLNDFLNGGALALEITPPKYAVMATVDGYQEILERRIFKKTGKVDMKRQVETSVAVKVIDMATRQVLPGITGVQLQKEERKKMVEPVQAVPSDNLVADLARASAAALIQDSLGALYPPKVLDVTGTHLMINRGEPAGFKVGTLVHLFLEKPVKDPDSGATYMNEIPVGIAKVQRSDDQRSFAEITENLGVEPGCVARPAK